ncbi:MAG: TonB-dependent receptor [Prolixibacteraceae bacterium]|jgi:TonB-linked SusC/RagA family outer membrane protein|nr:TonB-dependent receptor [Prolixibacteraceae bacterium]
MKNFLLLLFLIMLSLTGFAQSVLTGTVETESGELIPGVTVLLKGSRGDATQGTVTDLDGNFSLKLIDKTGVLVFSFIGLETIEKDFQGNAHLKIVMKSKGVDLDEIVAVGYGSQRRASVVGAISTVSTKDLVQSPTANLGNALAGRLPGLTTIQTSGQPGDDDPQIFIRGRATWVDSNPLYIIDGVERESITNIDPNEIETVSILKDASATAVYGVKGANGVIIITTRRGKNQKPVVSFTSLSGVQVPTRIPNFLRSYDTAKLKNEAILNDYYTDVFNDDGTLKMNTEDVTSLLRQNGGFSADDLAAFKSGTADSYYYPDVDWWEELVRKFTPQQQYNLNISGGSNAARYFVSVGYLNQEGIFKTDSKTTNFGFNRYNLRSNLDLDVTEDLTFSINLAARFENKSLPNGGTWNSEGDALGVINHQAPYEAAILNPDGRPAYGENKTNGWAALNKTGYMQQQNYVVESSFEFKYDLSKLIQGLSIKSKVAYDSYFYDEKRYGEQVMWSHLISQPGEPYNYEFEGADEPFNYLWGDSNEHQKTYLDASIYYDRTFDKNNITALLLYNQSDYRAGGDIPYRYSGLVSRLTYNYNQKYFTEFNLGYNGSENFAPGKRFGFFPSFSLGWLLSEENFIKEGAPYVSVLKLRGSYGLVGNDKIGGNRFLYIQDFTSKTSGTSEVGAKFGPDAENREYIYETAASNPNVTWEKARKANIGLEGAFLNDLLSFNADVFYEQRTDILMSRQTVMSYFGVDAPPANIGETENKGFEFNLTHRKKLGNDFNYWIKANISYAKNKIINKDEPPNMVPWQKDEGQSIGQFQGYMVDGYFQDWDDVANSPEQIGTAVRPGDLKYIDYNDDGVIDDKDRTYIGYTGVPNLNYGFSMGVNFADFDFSVLFQGTEFSNMYIGDGMMFEFTNKNGKLLDHHLNRWAYYTDPFTGEFIDTRATATYPRLNNGVSPNQKVSTFFLLDNSYLKLRNIEFGYTFNGNLLKKMNLSKLRIYCTANNLLTWTKVKQVAPEGNPEWGFGQNYPQMAVYSFGLNVTF